MSDNHEKFPFFDFMHSFELRIHDTIKLGLSGFSLVNGSYHSLLLEQQRNTQQSRLHQITAHQ